MMRSRIVRTTVAGGLVLHATTAVAWAAKEAQVAETEGSWLKWAVAVGLAVVICVSGFLDAKRSHLT